MHKILVVEDDLSMRNLLSTTLKAHGYAFFMASSGENAILQAASHKPDIVLLDLGLPDIDGVQVIENIRSYSAAPIIIISARSEDEDKIKALDAGADDYLTKPFSTQELLARIRVAQRRVALISGASEPVFENGALRVDFAAGTAYINDNELHLTPIEFKLLSLLCQNVGKVLTHAFITQKIWNSQLESDKALLRVFMTTLRKKLENPKSAGKISNEKNEKMEFIHTHIGVGYKMIKF